MSMINCPQCGEQISDKAKKCIHCGVELHTEEVKQKVCEECGRELEEGMEICPNCGCPVTETFENTVQQVEVTKLNISVNKKKKKIIIGIVLAVLILAITAVVAFFIKVNIDKRNQEKLAQEYYNNFDTAVNTMLLGATEAESAGNLIHSVWSNAIYEKEDDETDKYTKEEYEYSSETYFVDFNEALENLMADSSFSKKIDTIKNNQNEVQNLMKKLQNPPEKYKEAYNALKEYFDAYIELVGCAVNPTGNLQSYTEALNSADTKTLNCYKSMSIYVEK